MPSNRSSEIEQLQATVAELQEMLLSSGRQFDNYRLPDPIRNMSEFTGIKKELPAWLEELEEIYQMYLVKGEHNAPDTIPSHYMRAIKNKIKGDARTVLCANGNPNTIPGIKRVLSEIYGDQKDLATNLSHLFHMKRGDRNNHKFYTDVKELSTKIKMNLSLNPLQTNDLIEILIVTKYLDNIGEPLASIIRQSKPTTLEDAYQSVCINQNAEVRNRPSYSKFPRQKDNYKDKPNSNGETKSNPPRFKPAAKPFHKNKAEVHNNEVNDDTDNDKDNDDDDDTLTDSTGRVTRQLEQFDFKIIYKKGKQNVVADGLSRIPRTELNLNEELSNQFFDNDPIYGPEIINKYANQLLIYRADDAAKSPYLACMVFPNHFRHVFHKPDYTEDDIKDILTRHLDPTKLNGIFADLNIARMCQHIIDTNFKNIKVHLTNIKLPDLISGTDQNEFIRKCHSFNHRGYKLTYEEVQKSVFFPRMLAKVKEFVKNCESCKFAKLWLWLWTTTNGKILVHDLDKSPVAIIHLGKAYVSNNYFRILHRVDLIKLQNSVETLLYHAKTNIDSADFLSVLIQTKVTKLEQTFLKLKPSTRVRRWEKLGSLWKYISGSPDAEDLRIINSTSNSLINANEKQIKINHIFEDRINKLTEKVNNVTIILNNTALKNDKDFRSVGLLFCLDELTQQLEDLEEAIVLAQHNIPSSRIINAEEITRIHHLLEGNNFIAGALDFASAYVVSSKESIAYILKVPRIKDAEYDLNFIEPVIFNNSRISISTNYYLQGPSSFALKSLCEMSRNVYVCSSTQLEPITKCIQQLMRGESATCPMERTYTNGIIKRVDDSNVIINDAEISITSNCSLNHRKLKGSFLVQFSNCTLFINDEMYSNINKEVQLASFVPTTGLTVNFTTITNKFPIEYLQKLHLEQRGHIKHINLRTDNIQWKLELFGWTSFGFGSTITIIFIVALSFWIWNRLPSRSSMSHLEELQSHQNPEEPSEPNRQTRPKITMVPQA
ncbi:uncharacterized protein LOC129765963 [Toxorhynchites rutilus septentrionalis]|uniref:uncharacterized protein LOC129765963 n=1 Tax=Toxorhynchites rutilus septentrionalis TaxID=329112 RepID=UPI002478ABE1|nr:uncharacterized protein LOC129765963 [Toxorhynchites rutilus septentrionalis]